MKIDYCCGDKSIADACETAGVKVEDLQRMLDETGAGEGERNLLHLQKSSLAELTKYIVDKHHVYTKQEIARLTALIAKVISALGEKHAELLHIGELFDRLSAGLTPHMFKEEKILFPYIVELEVSVAKNTAAPFAPFGTVKNPIARMMMEHDTAGDILRELRALSSDYTVPADSCISYQTLFQALETLEKDLHQHIHLENNILFPRAIEMEVLCYK